MGSIVSLVFFFGSAALLNPLCLVLSPLAVIPLIVYPYGKRFTDFPHAILGLAQMVAPIGAWLAVTGTFEGSLPAMVLGSRRWVVDRWIRPYIRLPGRRSRPAYRRTVVPGAFGIARGPAHVDGGAHRVRRAVRLKHAI